MKWIHILVGVVLVIVCSTSCRSTKKLQTAINRKDTSLVNLQVSSAGADSLKGAYSLLDTVEQRRIDFRTFSAKIKVRYQDQHGQQPDFYAFIRLYKDSVLWVSINSSFLSIEAFRILINKDQIVILNKLDKEVEYHPFAYIQHIAHIPLTFSTLQDMLIGYPVYLGDSVVSYRQTENRLLVGTIGHFFKNLLTISADNKLVERSKLDDINVGKNRTADLTYNNYETVDGFPFSTDRDISVAEKTRVDISLLFKQFEFNKELSFPFAIPRNYRTK
ncbi:MAG: DUF4292 domain-containing protein [Bacteroidota bacterium]|nr:DUF4292 domain-containing protein [Bacteroidota bacterium]